MSESSNLIFISFFNYAGIELAKNHLESLKRNNINNYIAFVADQESYQELSSLQYNVSLYKSENKISIEAHDFGSHSFNNLSYIRYSIIHQLLKQGKTVWYLDIDTVVLTDLNAFYLQIQTDVFDICFQDDINMLCTGCMLFKPGYSTIELIEFIITHQTIEENDQIIMNRILNTTSVSLNISIFNPNQFPNGLLYFKELSNNLYYASRQTEFKKSVAPIFFIHANYMTGNETKINALKSKQLWFI